MIGDKLAHLRKLRGMSQRELARALNVSDKAVKNWESDISDPNIKNIIALCLIFHVTSDELLGISDDMISVSQLTDKDRYICRTITQAYIDAVLSNK